MNNFVKLALDNGGYIKPLIIPSDLTGGTGLMNPSIFIDEDDIIKVNLIIKILYFSLFSC